jgi:methyl-accepting chemotaxis protein
MTMKWFLNMKISTKLLLGFSIVLILAIAVGIVGIMNMQSITSNSDIMYRNMTVPIAEMSQVATAFQRVRVNLRDIIAANDSAKIADYVDRIAQRRAEIDEHATSFSKTISTQKVQDAYDAFLTTRADFVKYMDQIVSLAQANRDEEANALLASDACYQSEQAEQNAILNLAELKKENAEAKSNENTDLSNSALIMMLAVLLAAVLLAAVIAIYISRMINSSMKRITQAAERIAAGDLCSDVSVNTKDEIGMLALAFCKMSENLNEVMSGISAASEQVTSGASQLSDSSMALSQGASEQASSIEELTASLEQISSQTKLNAQNASQANKLAGAAQSNASQGNEQMKDMLKAMEEINISSTNISKIIKVIDDIAFQTNILALNAAVEAARAGQHGKGFAVVAEEVRNLAAKSASAAKETTEMIEGSIKKVEAGTKLATHTAEALNKIVDGVAQAASLVNQIDVASNEQATGLAQINQAVMQVSQVVQANSSVSEQSAAASKELAGQAEMMRESVKMFKLRGMRGATAQAVSAKANAAPTVKAPRAVEPPVRAMGKTSIALSDEEFGKY